MTDPTPSPSTGLPSLDQILQNVLPGDNIVWQVDTVSDYSPLVEPFVDAALAAGKKLLYFRFARHGPLVADGRGAIIHQLDPTVGFESFTASIHRAIEQAGRGAYYVFDCLSDLAADWYSDLMLGNFFMVTCPYLYELETVTYFALLRDSHSRDAVDSIRNTTQLLVNVFRREGILHVHPLKVDGRRSPTMYLPHAWVGESFRPITESAILAQVLGELHRGRGDDVSPPLEVWDRKFQQAREILGAVRSEVGPSDEAKRTSQSLLRMMLTRDDRVAALASQVLHLEDLLAIRKRMIGTGLVGGKSAGMLLARAILAQADAHWEERLEAHDSYFIGSDVFYTYLVKNGCWRARRELRKGTSLLDGASEERERIRNGVFPGFIERQFVAMLEHYGQSPIIVRSSSLLEDGFGNAFTGKYDSIFCPNQGSPDERLAFFLSAVKAVYASTMSESALLYREHRGLLDRDEQMAILVQRVSGAVRGTLFYPSISGVALSYNPYVWNADIDPNAGMVRLVFGLGTRAVNRSDDDYTRLVSLNAPLKRPEASLDEVTEYAQRRVDVIDLAQDRLASVDFEKATEEAGDLPIDLFATPRPGTGRVLTFEKLLSATSFVSDMRTMLATLRDTYCYPVDVEFTGNFVNGSELRIDLVQCRPLQVKEGGAITSPPTGLSENAVLLASRGPVVGQSSNARVGRIVYVDPDVYALLAQQDRYEVARVIGRLTRLELGGEKGILLLGPGRWGTTTPSLGVPVSFAEIQSVSAICEIVRIGMNVTPDVSLGSHFFNDLVEANMLYLALYPNREGYRLDEPLLRMAPNRLAEILPDDARMATAIRVIDLPLAAGGEVLWLNANCVKQEVLCYFQPVAK